MLLGSGELSRELTLAFQRLGREVVAVDRYANAPAHGVADRAAVVKMNDAEALTAIIERANPLYVVAESGRHRSRRAGRRRRARPRGVSRPPAVCG